MTEEVSVTVKDILGDEESELIVRALALMSAKFQRKQGLPRAVADACAVRMLVDFLKGFGEWNAKQDGVTVLESELTPSSKPVKKDTLQ